MLIYENEGKTKIMIAMIAIQVSNVWRREWYKGNNDDNVTTATAIAITTDNNGKIKHK